MTPRSLAPPTRMNKHGRGHSYTLDGTKCDGVTTLIKNGVPAPALVGWAAREAAEFVAANRSILTELGDAALVDLVKGAPYRDRDAAANRGTEVHRLAAALAEGTDVDVPAELQGHVDSYIDWFLRWQPDVVAVERTVINRQHRYMGCLDLLARLGGELWLIDLKTNKSGPFGETALQLAAYGNAETMLVAPGVEEPMPRVDAYGVVWVTGDGWELYRYDVTDREFRTFLFAAEVARWREQRGEVVRGGALAQPPLLRVVNS